MEHPGLDPWSLSLAVKIPWERIPAHSRSCCHQDVGPSCQDGQTLASSWFPRMLLMFRKSTGLELEPNRAEFWPSHGQAPGVPHWGVHGDPRRDQRSKGLLVKVRLLLQL